MENKINFFKTKPLAMFLIIVLVVLILFVVFQFVGLHKPQKILPPSETVKEEALPAAEIKLQPKEAPILSSEKKFIIQVASFQDKARAEIVVNGLKQKGYQPAISPKELPKKGIWYRVFVGEFATEEEAKSLLDKLKEDYEGSFIKLK